MKLTRSDSHRRILEDVASAILKEVNGVVSLILVNSFSRGEATPLSDFDIEVVFSTPLLPVYLRKVKETEKRINKEILKDKDLKVTIGPNIRPLLRRAPKSAFFYDLKRTGKVLYGENPLELIPIERPEEIARSFSIDYLLNVLISFAPDMRTEYFHRELTAEEARKITYSCTKTILGCTSALLILKGLYRSSYTERVATFLRTFEESYAPLRRTMPDLPSFVHLSYEYRRYGRSESLMKPLDFWFKARDFLEEALKYCLYEIWGLTGNDWIDILERFIDRSGSNISNNLQYFLLTTVLERRSYPAVLIKGKSIGRIFQSALLLTILSLNRNGTIDYIKLQHAYDLIKAYGSPKGRSGYVNWDHLKDFLISHYNYACPTHGQQ